MDRTVQPVVRVEEDAGAVVDAADMVLNLDSPHRANRLPQDRSNIAIPEARYSSADLVRLVPHALHARPSILMPRSTARPWITAIARVRMVTKDPTGTVADRARALVESSSF